MPVLEEAVGSFPEGTEDLNYAYSLFNLGHALRLSGRPEEAIPILERRQEIPDQEDAVRKELEAASAEAGYLGWRLRFRGGATLCQLRISRGAIGRRCAVVVLGRGHDQGRWAFPILRGLPADHTGSS